MPAWYDLQALPGKQSAAQRRNMAHDMKGLERSREMIEEIIAKEEVRDCAALEIEIGICRQRQ